MPLWRLDFSFPLFCCHLADFWREFQFPLLFYLTSRPCPICPTCAFVSVIGGNSWSCRRHRELMLSRFLLALSWEHHLPEVTNFQCVAQLPVAAVLVRSVFLFLSFSRVPDRGGSGIRGFLAGATLWQSQKPRTPPWASLHSRYGRETPFLSLSSPRSWTHCVCHLYFHVTSSNPVLVFF